MEALAQQYVHDDTEEATSVALVEKLVEHLQQGVPFVQLVAALREPLTDADDDERRCRAVGLVAQVAGRAELRPQEVEHLAEFFSGKLEDWACAKAALEGCLTLLTSPGAAAAVAAKPELALAIGRALAASVQLPALTVSGRQLGLQLWLKLLQDHGERLVVGARLNLAACTAALVEGENDPRCLLLAFACVRAACGAYDAPACAPYRNEFEAEAGELFDVAVEPYFPVRFTPKKGDPQAITRRQLADAVAGCMAAAPEFAPAALPLLAEKLGSALSESKDDALDALPLCCAGWGAAAMADHLGQVWLMLKQELLAPSTLDAAPADDLDAARAAARRATAALRACCAALGPGQLDRVALADVAFEDLQSYLAIKQDPDQEPAGGGASGGGGSLAALRGRPAQRLACIVDALGAVAASGPLSCAAACAALIDPALDALLGPAAPSPGPGAGAAHAPAAARALDLASATLGGALAALHAVTAAVATAPPEARRGDLGAPHPLQERAPRVLQLLSAVDAACAAAAAAAAAPAAAGELAPLAAQACVWALRLRLQLLLLEAGGAVQLPEGALREALAQLVRAALGQAGGGGGGDFATSDVSNLPAQLWLDWDCEVAPSDAAMAAVEALAAPSAAAAARGAGGASALGGAGDAAAAPVKNAEVAAAAATCVEALLLPALRSPAAARALAVLQLLSGGEHGGAWQLLAWLQPLVTDGLADPEPTAEREDLLVQYLECIHQYALAQLPLDLPPQQAAAAADMVAQLLAALQKGGGGGGGEALQPALLLLSGLAARCSAAAQAPLLLDAGEWAAAAAGGAGGYGGAARRAALAAALLVGMRPELLRGDSVRDLAAALARAALAPGAGPARAAAAAALGAVVNKWQPGGAGGAAAAEAAAAAAGDAQDLALAVARDIILPAIQQQQQGQQQQGQGQRLEAGQVVSAGVDCIAWMARGLAMLRVDGWQQLAGWVLDVLPAAAAGSGAATSGGDSGGGSMEVAEAAARLFEVLVSDGGGGGWRLDARSGHARARPLWQQKAFVLALKALEQRAVAAAAAADAAAGEAAGSASGGGGGGGGGAGLRQAERLQYALALSLAGLLSSAPRAVYRSAAPVVAPLLAPCLARASGGEPGACGSGGGGGAHEQRLMACLLVASDYLTDAALAGLMEAEADRLVPLLASLARRAGAGCAGAAAVRETALQCLVAVMRVPYRLLHPHRRAVLRAIAGALDDDRRAVRLAAVGARRVWSIT